MLVQIRPKVLLVDEADAQDLLTLSTQHRVKTLLVVDPNVKLPAEIEGVKVLLIPLRMGSNPPYIKDIACHTLKYFTEFNETVAVCDKNADSQAVYVISRALCEAEQKNMYEIFQEVKDSQPEAAFIPALYM